MKLRNKKTGEIAEAFGICVIGEKTFIRFEDEYGTYKFQCNSLAKLNEEWEDYEDKEEYWFIDFNGEIKESEVLGFEWQGRMKEIGNYFETKEEAQKAVEKLKAWERLKDKGFRFERFLIGGEYGNTITFSEYIEYNDETRADLDLLFGGKE